MSRLGDWWSARRAAKTQRVSSDSEIGPQKAVWWLLALFSLAFAIMILWAVFLAGRWAYREIRGESTSSEQSTQNQNESQSGSNEAQQNNNPTNQDGGQQQQPESTPAPGTPEPSRPAPQPPQLPRSGPSEE